MAKSADNSSDLDYADTLWKAADALRVQVDAAEYKHVVLGLLFLKYISDAFESRRAKLTEELAADGITGPQVESLLENRDEYTARARFLGAARGAVAESAESGHAAGYRHAHR